MFPTPPLLLMLGLLAQAEAAPAEEVQPPPPAPSPEVFPSPLVPAPPPPAEPVPDSPVKIGLRAGAEFRLTADIAPKVGYAFSPFLQYQFVQFAQRLGLAARTQFTFSRFSKPVTIQEDRSRGIDEDYEDLRTLSVYDFAALAVAELRLGPVLPWVGAGLGLTIASFTSREAQYHPGDWGRTRMMVVGAAGVDVRIKGHLQIGVHAEVRGIVNQPKFPLASGESLTPLGDRLGLQGAILYQF